MRVDEVIAQLLATWVEQDPDWELAVRPPLNLVCLRHRDGDEVRLFTRNLNDITDRMPEVVDVIRTSSVPSA